MAISDRDYAMRREALQLALAASRDASGATDPMEYVEDFYDWLTGTYEAPEELPETDLNEFNGDDEKVIDLNKALKDHNLID